MTDARLDVLVVGAGQAGLAAGYRLKQAGLTFLVLEAAPRVGDSWRRRYESLTLFTPRAFSQLPGLKLSSDPEGYPARDEFAGYLEAYAAAFALPVRTGARVSRLAWDGNGFRAELADGTDVSARAVIVATGGFQVPAKPSIASGFAGSVVQLDPETYRGPQSIPADGRVLVIGDGASGRDIAVELAVTRETLLAAGKPRKLFPERILGKSVWWWLRNLGLMRVGAQSFLGRLMRRADPFPDRGRSLAAIAGAGVDMKPRLVTAEGRTATFTDGSSSEVEAVVWAVGYRDHYEWLETAGAKDSAGKVLHDEGVSPIPGLFFVGRPWQRNRASALVMGAGEDAGEIVRRILDARSVLA